MAPSFPAVCARPAIAAALRDSGAYAGVLVQQWMQPSQLPIVYHTRYNITFGGLENLHAFDSKKFGKVVDSLTKAGLLCIKGSAEHSKRPKCCVVEPLEASLALLADVHTDEYLRDIHSSNLKIVQVIEMPPFILIPNTILQWRLITPMKYHVGGTMLAAALAFERGWAINVGGGMHHGFSSDGMGWCPFDDIMLAVRRVRSASNGAVRKVLYIDVDAHQGNGVCRDKLEFNDTDFFIVDVYNANTFPNDEAAWPAIDIDVRLRRGCADAQYLKALRGALDQAARACPDPDLVFYNAGTDILEGDPLGHMAVSAEGVVARDQMVWEYALQVAKCPIVMTLSGGYAKCSASVISQSLASLIRTFKLNEAPAQAD